MVYNTEQFCLTMRSFLVAFNLNHVSRYCESFAVDTNFYLTETKELESNLK